MTQEFILGLLSLVVTVLIGAVGRLWYNHQQHADKAVRGLWYAIDEIKVDIRKLCADKQEHGERLARLETKQSED